MNSKGRVYLIGAGPGDPDLITLKAVKRLNAADVVVYDYLANPRVMEHAPPSAERIYVGKQAGAHTMPQEEINALLVRLAREGRTVVRLKGGDPYIFGRGGEEASALAAAGIPFEVIPGITSAVAVPASAGIPLTDRRAASSVAFVTGHEDPRKAESRMRWAELAAGPDTLVFLMGIRNLDHITEQLIRHGRSPDTPAAVIHRGTTPFQQSAAGTLATIAEQVREAGILAPGILVVGDVVALRKQLNWYENRPLFGKTVVVTRAREQASLLLERLEDLGARCLVFPTIQTVPPQSYDELDRALNDLSSYDWVLFTSVNGVRYVFDRLRTFQTDARALHGVRIGAIGPATAKALEEKGIYVDFVPSEYRAEGIIEELAPRLHAGMRILLPRAAQAREILPRKLQEAGAVVHVVSAYETILPSHNREEIRSHLAGGEVDLITFTASSTVTNFVRMFDAGEAVRLLEGVDVACIGPITADTAARHGIRTAVQPLSYTIDGLVDAIVEHYTGRKP